MGAINYKTGKYITMAVRTDDDDVDELEYMYEEAKEIVDKYDFENFKVYLEYGYHEGFQLTIESYFDWCLDSYRERKEINKEIGNIKAILLELMNIGLVSTYPGWCMGYADYKQTRKDIAKAIKKIREEASKLMTYNQWKRSGKSFEEMINA